MSSQLLFLLPLNSLKSKYFVYFQLFLRYSEQNFVVKILALIELVVNMTLNELVSKSIHLVFDVGMTSCGFRLSDQKNRSRSNVGSMLAIRLSFSGYICRVPPSTCKSRKMNVRLIPVHHMT